MMTLRSSNKNSSFFDIVLWTMIVILFAVGIVANFYFAEYAIALRLIGWVAIALIAVGLALQTKVGKISWEFIKQARTELRKVVWPTRQETVQTTLVVMGMVIVMALFLWGIDSLLLWIIGILTG